MAELTYPANDAPSPDGVQGFQDTEAEHTPLNIPNDHIAKRVQNRATWQSPHDGKRTHNASKNYVPPGGREAMQDGFHHDSTGAGIQHSREGSQTFTGNEVRGKVVVTANHPNKNLNNLYG